MESNGKEYHTRDRIVTTNSITHKKESRQRTMRIGAGRCIGFY